MDSSAVLTFDVRLGLVTFQLSLLISQFFFQMLILQRKVDVTEHLITTALKPFSYRCNMYCANCATTKPARFHFLYNLKHNVILQPRPYFHMFFSQRDNWKQTFLKLDQYSWSVEPLPVITPVPIKLNGACEFNLWH